MESPPASNGQPNFVHINLKPQYAKSIPSTATARVVPSNVFAVSSVQLVDRGPGAPIRAGAHIAEDTQLPTVLFQTTVSKLRDVLVATGRGRDDHLSASWRPSAPRPTTAASSCLPAVRS